MQTFKAPWRFEQNTDGFDAFTNGNQSIYKDDLFKYASSLVDQALAQIQLGDTLSIEISVGQESPLQGEDDELTTMQEAGVAMAANIVEQGKRIEALVQTSASLNYKSYQAEKRIEVLEQLLREWRSAHCLTGSQLNDLQKRTIQQLEEED